MAYNFNGDNLYDVFSGKKLDLQTKTVQESYTDIVKKINTDTEYLKKMNIPPAFIAMGVFEVRVMVETMKFHGSPTETLLPFTINGLRVILIPINSFCAVVPSMESLWRIIEVDSHF